MSHWLIGVALLATLLRGQVTYYAQGLMEQVLANRLAYGHVEPCENCVGMIAVLERADVGKHGYLRVDGRIIGPLLAVDCAAAQDYARLKARGLIAELDYDTARSLGMVGVGPLADAELWLMEAHR